MKGKNPPIMAIHATSRGFGFVVMSGPFSLLDWGVREADKHKNANCMAKLSKLVDHFDPHTLVLEDPTQGQKRAARICRLYASIAELCHSRSIDMAVFSRADMYRCYASVGAVTWNDIAEAVGRQLEPLRKRVPSRRKAWQSESRAMSVFAAAAIAMTYWQMSEVARSAIT